MTRARLPRASCSACRPSCATQRCREFLGWVQGSNGPLMSEYMRAATIHPEARLGELSSFQRAALIGELRFRRRIPR